MLLVNVRWTRKNVNTKSEIQHRCKVYNRKVTLAIRVAEMYIFTSLEQARRSINEKYYLPVFNISFQLKYLAEKKPPKHLDLAKFLLNLMFNFRHPFRSKLPQWGYSEMQFDWRRGQVPLMKPIIKIMGCCEVLPAFGMVKGAVYTQVSQVFFILFFLGANLW